MKDAVSFRTRKASIYDKKSNTPFKISRSKFFNFMSCKRCFYLDRVKGLKEPSMPGWALNVTVDELLKKEFDKYRKEQKPHPIMVKYNLNFVPYQHKDLDNWRNSLKGGISYLDEKRQSISKASKPNLKPPIPANKSIKLNRFPKSYFLLV